MSERKHNTPVQQYWSQAPRSESISAHEAASAIEAVDSAPAPTSAPVHAFTSTPAPVPLLSPDSASATAPVPAPESVPAGGAEPDFASAVEAVDLDCGIPLRRIASWLEDELALHVLCEGPDSIISTGHDKDVRNVHEFAHPIENTANSQLLAPTGWVYAFRENTCSGECTITIAQRENRNVGRVSIERTHMHVEGDQAAISAFMRLFTLRFISAGG